MRQSEYTEMRIQLAWLVPGYQMCLKRYSKEIVKAQLLHQDNKNFLQNEPELTYQSIECHTLTQEYTSTDCHTLPQECTNSYIVIYLSI